MIRLSFHIFSLQQALKFYIFVAEYFLDFLSTKSWY